MKTFYSLYIKNTKIGILKYKTGNAENLYNPWQVYVIVSITMLEL